MDDEPTPEELELLNLYMYGVAPDEASASKAEVDPLATMNEDASASIDVTYRVVWTAGEPSDCWRSDPKFSRIADLFPSFGKARLVGSIRITVSTAEDGIPSKCQARGAAESAPTPQPVPEGKIPCIAMLHHGTLGARCTCLYDTATDSFDTFGENDETWSREKGYEDYGYIDVSTKKWNQGSWVSVEDDNGNEFLFLSVEQGHGVSRVWRPNLVAKRVVGDGETKLTYEEGLRLGVNEDGAF